VNRYIGRTINDVTIQRRTELRLGLGLAEAGDAVAGFALAALLEEGRALKALEDSALDTEGGRRAQAAML